MICLMNRFKRLDGIVCVFGWHHAAAVLNVHEEEFRRPPRFAPEIVVGNQLETSSSDEEVVDKHADEEINEK